MLFKNENDIKPFYPVSAAFKFLNLKPIIEFQAEPKFKESIGAEMYAEVVAYMDDVSALNADKKQLLRLCRSFVANYALFLNVSPGSVAITENGIQVMQNTNWVPASQYKIEELKKFFQNAAFTAEESMLEFLEEKKNIFTTWAGSSAFTEYKNLFLNNSKTFSYYHNINSSRRVFRSLIPIIRRVQDEIVKGAICSDLYDELITQIKDETISENNAKLLPYIKMAVAKKSIAEALTEWSIQMEGGDGLILLETEPSSVNTSTGKQPLNQSRLNLLYRKCEEIANNQINSLIQFLDANVDTYPLYKNSTCYVAPSGLSDDINTDDDSSVYLI